MWMWVASFIPTVAVVWALVPQHPRHVGVRRSNVAEEDWLESTFWYEDDDEDLDVQARLDEAALQGCQDRRILAAWDDDDTAQAIREEGVALVDGALSPATARRLRDTVLASVETADASAFSAVLGPRAAAQAEVTRVDLRLSLDDQAVAAAAEEIARSRVGDALGYLTGPEALLWELAAVVSYPGSAHQLVHSDTLFDDRPCLFTAFVALQDVEATMGPTLFVLGTHKDPTAHALAEADPTSRAAFLGAATPYLAHLRIGQASLYDSRLLHAATPNTHPSNTVRVLFYLTFCHPDADADDLANPDAHSILPGVAARRLTLGDFRRGLPRPSPSSP